MKENQKFSKGRKLYSVPRQQFYVVTKIEARGIHVHLEGSANLRYWVPNGRARKIFVPAEEVSEHCVQAGDATARLPIESTTQDYLIYSQSATGATPRRPDARRSADCRER